MYIKGQRNWAGDMSKSFLSVVHVQIPFVQTLLQRFSPLLEVWFVLSRDLTRLFHSDSFQRNHPCAWSIYSKVTQSRRSQTYSTRRTVIQQSDLDILIARLPFPRQGMYCTNFNGQYWILQQALCCPVFLTNCTTPRRACQSWRPNELPPKLNLSARWPCHHHPKATSVRI